jgi:inorganic pyrophosphatase
MSRNERWEDLLMTATTYWQALDELAATCAVVIDRPKGTAHPRFPAMVYPLDYGYLQGTSSSDGHEIDCWVGSLAERNVTGVALTVDLLKRDLEAKVLLGCTADEMQTILTFHNGGPQSAMLLLRERKGQ